MANPDNGARLGQGTIMLTLGDEQIELKPTLFALQQLNRRYGGIQDILDKIVRLDFDVICDVVYAGAGAGYSNPKARQRLQEKLFAAGMAGGETDEVALAASNFLQSLMRGGRPPATPEQAAGEEGFAGNVKSAS